VDNINAGRGSRATVGGLENQLRDDIADANRIKRDLDPARSDSEARGFQQDMRIRSDEKQIAGLEAFQNGQRFQKGEGM
jgi:hypothetical protein